MLFIYLFLREEISLRPEDPRATGKEFVQEEENQHPRNKWDSVCWKHNLPQD